MHKQQKGNKKLLPKKSKNLLAQWNATKGQALPSVSTYNYTNKDSDLDEDMEGQEWDEEADELVM